MLALAVVVLFVGRLLFRTQLQQLGGKVDEFVRVLSVAVAIFYAIQLILVLGSEP